MSAESAATLQLKMRAWVGKIMGLTGMPEPFAKSTVATAAAAAMVLAPGNVPDAFDRVMVRVAEDVSMAVTMAASVKAGRS